MKVDYDRLIAEEKRNSKERLSLLTNLKKQQTCPHKLPNGKSAWKSNDGKFGGVMFGNEAICSICGKLDHDF